MRKDIIQTNALQEAVNAISSTQSAFEKDKSIVEEPVQVFLFILLLS